jgi:SNF family Na+-dependent transporter
MTEVELYEITNSSLEVTAAFMSNYATHVSIYLSLIFGYCVVAYAAGSNLTKFQVIVASVMFIVAAELQAILMIVWVQSAQDVVRELAKINPRLIGERGNPIGGQILGIALWQVGIITCLAFMWSIRRPKTE